MKRPLLNRVCPSRNVIDINRGYGKEVKVNRIFRKGDPDGFETRNVLATYHSTVLGKRCVQSDIQVFQLW